MSKHSAIVGGSNCERLLQCPGSWQAIRALPPAADVTSEYAEEGVFAHEVMAWLMQHRQASPGIPNPSLPGLYFHDREVTQAHVDTLILPALESLADLEKTYGDGFSVIGVEERVKFPNVPGAFGTCDVVLHSKTHILLADWKFGAGVPVPAVYRDPEGDVINAQLAFYAAAALHSAPSWFTKKTIVTAIIQPRSSEPLTHTVIARKELRDFVEDVENAVIAAIGDDPPVVKGRWCRFAKCKVTCKHWVGPLLDLSAILPPAKEDTIERDQVTPYGQYLTKAKALADIAALFKDEIDEQLHAYLQQGGTVPGWRLKAKTKMRQWIDADTVAKTLAGLGFQEDQIWQRKLATFAAADATAKKLGVKIPENLRVAPPTSETTIAPVDDPAPVVETAVLLEQFQASLLALRKQPLWIEPGMRSAD